MPKFRVNHNTKSPNYDHEVHKEGCQWWPYSNYTELGEHANCQTAVTLAKQKFSDANGCKDCSPACHRG